MRVGKFVKIFLLTAFFFLLITGGAYWAYRTYIPDVAVLLTEYPRVDYDAQTKKQTIVLEKVRPSGWVSVGDVSKAALGAIVVSEDSAFFQHDGYDLNQIQLALQESWNRKRLGRGASTITQQVIKNIFLTNERSIKRKVLELYLSTEIERVLNKKKILELYINIAEMGPGIFGIGQASRYYFSKPPKELSAREGAFLAMLLPSPVRYSQSFREKRLTTFAKRMIESILDKMVVAGYIPAEERDALRATALSFESIPDIDPAALENAEESTDSWAEATPESDSSNISQEKNAGDGPETENTVEPGDAAPNSEKINKESSNESSAPSENVESTENADNTNN